MNHSEFFVFKAWSELMNWSKLTKLNFFDLFYEYRRKTYRSQIIIVTEMLLIYDGKNHNL